MTSYETTGETVEAAVAIGLSAMKVSRNAVNVQILAKPKKGSFGNGDKLARVKLTLTDEEIKRREEAKKRKAHSHKDYESMLERALLLFRGEYVARDSREGRRLVDYVMSAPGYDIPEVFCIQLGLIYWDLYWDNGENINDLENTIKLLEKAKDGWFNDESVAGLIDVAKKQLDNHRKMIASKKDGYSRDNGVNTAKINYLPIIAVFFIILIMVGAIAFYAGQNYSVFSSGGGGENLTNSQENATDDTSENSNGDVFAETQTDAQTVSAAQPDSYVKVETPEPVIAQIADERDYILPFSSERELTDSDLRELTKDELRLARNEIFARYGRLFIDEELQAYFDSKLWYNNLPKIPPGDELELTGLELKNIALIQAYEERN